MQYVRELLARQHEQYRHNLSLEDQKLYHVQTQLKSVEVRAHCLSWSQPCRLEAGSFSRLQGHIGCMACKRRCQAPADGRKAPPHPACIWFSACCSLVAGAPADSTTVASCRQMPA